MIERNADLSTFRRDAMEFLSRHARHRQTHAFTWGEGDDRFGYYVDRSTEEESREIAAAKAWRAREFDAGFGWISGPREYGGRGLPAEYDLLYRSLKAEFDTPDEQTLTLALGMVGPTILAHGQPALRERYVRAIQRGEVIACQLFSEPDAGSDLASLRTRAVRDGDEWLVSGAKVWTSGAHRSDIGMLLCRTGAGETRHRGITAFIVDMRAPGLTVRPMRQMTGGAHFNEVHLDQVRVPDGNRLGEVDDGWRVTRTTLMNERATLGAGNGEAAELLQRLIGAIRHFGLNDNPTLRQELAALYANVQVAQLTNQRALAQIRPGEAPGPLLSIAKLTRTMNVSRACALASRVLGMQAIADSGAWGTYVWANYILSSPASRIGGGTDEIQRNILAERVLGLPREPSP